MEGKHDAKGIEARLKTLEDADEINKLQRAYGYYLEHWERKESNNSSLQANGPRNFYMLLYSFPELLT
jgi:hypothetical protein